MVSLFSPYPPNDTPFSQGFPRQTANHHWKQEIHNKKQKGMNGMR